MSLVNENLTQRFIGTKRYKWILNEPRIPAFTGSLTHRRAEAKGYLVPIIYVAKVIGRGGNSSVE